MELTKDVKAYLKLRKKLMVLEYARRSGSVAKALKEFKLPKAIYCKWKKILDKDGEDGLLKKHPVANNHPNKIKEDVIEKVLFLRKEYQLGSWRIKWYLERYHDISISESSVTRILKRYGVECLQKKAVRRALHSKRYNKSVPGHHVHVDVKVLLKDLAENEYKRFQYTAIDDATRIRALQIYPQQNQANAIEFINYVVRKFPFRIKTIRTDRGHEFQAKFHWHVEDPRAWSTTTSRCAHHN
jgi:transposase